MARLVDTSVLVYRHDPRAPRKQEIATRLLHSLWPEEDRLIIPHPALVEFVAACTRPCRDLDGAPLLALEDALLEAEDLSRLHRILYPDAATFRTALHGVSTYRLPWFDAHLWAYAEANGVPEILSEDFEHGRHYGGVRVVDPFLGAAGEVPELPAMYA